MPCSSLSAMHPGVSMQSRLSCETAARPCRAISGFSHRSNSAHAHSHGSELSETRLRVRGVETILNEKGYVDSATLDAYETKIGPHNRARVMAKAWRAPLAYGSKL